MSSVLLEDADVPRKAEETESRMALLCVVCESATTVLRLTLDIQLPITKRHPRIPTTTQHLKSIFRGPIYIMKLVSHGLRMTE